MVSVSIPRRPSTDRPTPSFAQERIWFLDRLTPGSPAYNRPAAFRMRGRLDAGVLKKCLNEILGRHETLRSSFPEREGEAELQISDALSLGLPLIDFTIHPENKRLPQAQRWAGEEARRPFNLSRAPLLRAHLLKLGADNHVLLVNFHHIIFDGWSEGIFARELDTLYRAALGEAADPLQDLPIQYSDYAAWQKATLQGDRLERLLSYWKKRMSRPLPTLRLPADRTRPALQTWRGARNSLLLSERLTRNLKAMSRGEGVTLFVTLISAFKVLLLRYTGEEDLVVGTPVSGRHHVETEGLIGLFINTLPLRSDLSGNPTFRDLLIRVRRVVLGALEHQQLPLEKLVEEVNPARDLSRTPLFQTMFNMRNLPGPPGTVAAGEFGFDSGIAQFDLTMEVMEVPEGLRCTAKYSTDLFDAPTITRMLSHFERLLEGIAASPEERIWQLPLLPESERRLVVEEWNETGGSYPDQSCLHQIFEQQAARTPDAIAAEFGSQCLTFDELNRRANRLAHFLRQRGVGAGKTVAILVDRSLDMVAAILAVLKAGGVCLPLDPEYPPLRHMSMLEDSSTGMLLAHSRFLDSLSRYDCEVHCLDGGQLSLEQESDENLNRPVHPDHPAYVFFTSGSTGTPKGVQLHHRGVVNCLSFLPQAYGLGDTDVVLQLASCSFDPSIRDTLGALIAGARIVLVPAEEAKDPARLVSRIQKHRVTCLLSVVPTMLNALMDAAEHVDCAAWTLRLLLVSGENLHLSDCRRARRVFGRSCAIANHYGPTECTMTTTYYRVPPQESDKGVAPIGRPIPNTRIYILDPFGSPAPVGVPGELCIAGTGISKGYLNQPELSAQSFVPDPFSPDPAAAMYKSGDLARYRSDGNLEILGRLDNQVKIRGNRVELEEVESHLRQHRSIKSAAASLRADEPGGPLLVAYIIQRGTDRPGIGELQSFMRQRVPEYMVPSKVVELETLPLTANRKIDRNALPKPQGTPPREHVPPGNEVEKKLAHIWETLLGTSNVGVGDDFFELGGHSILATRLCSQIEKAFRKRVSLADLFLSPTVEKLALLLAREKETVRDSTLVAIQGGGSKPPVFWVHSLGGHIMMYRNLASHLGDDQPVYAFEPQLSSDHPRIEEMASHYLQDLIAHSQGPYLLGGQSFGGLVAFEMARQLHEQGAPIALLAILDTYAPAHRRSFPLITRGAFRLSRWIDFQLQNLRQLRGRKKLLYLQDRIAMRLVEMEMYKNPERERLIRLGRAHAHASRSYKPDPYPGTLTLFRAQRQPPMGYGDPQLGWGKLAADIEIQPVPGTHTSLTSEPHVITLAAKLADCIERAARASGEDRLARL